MSDIIRRDPRAEWIARNRLHPLHAAMQKVEASWMGPNGLIRKNPHAVGFIGPNGIKRIDRSGAQQGGSGKRTTASAVVQLPLHVIEQPAFYIAVVPDMVGGRLSSHDRDLLGLAHSLAGSDGAVLAVVFNEHKESNFSTAGVDRLLVIEGEAFEGYFRQSEQLPTRLLLAADGTRAAGLMLQKLPGDSGDAEGWNHGGALFDTLGPAELLACDTTTLLTRLFHEGGVRLLGSRPLRFACSCSRERVESMLVSLGAEEARAAVADDEAKVRCEFCGEEYRFSSEQIEQLLAAAEVSLEAPERAQ